MSLGDIKGFILLWHKIERSTGLRRLIWPECPGKMTSTREMAAVLGTEAIIAVGIEGK